MIMMRNLKMMMSTLRRRSLKSPEEQAYAERCRELSARIAKLEKSSGPRETDSGECLPPPEELLLIERLRRFEEQAARGAIRNLRRAQGQSILLMILLLAAVTTVVSWALQVAQG